MKKTSDTTHNGTRYELFSMKFMITELGLHHVYKM